MDIDVVIIVTERVVGIDVVNIVVVIAIGMVDSGGGEVVCDGVVVSVIVMGVFNRVFLGACRCCAQVCLTSTWGYIVSRANPVEDVYSLLMLLRLLLC